MSQSRPITIMDTIDGYLDSIHDAFFRAFEAEGLGQLFKDYWAIMSPRHFAVEESAVIDQYYNKQIARIPQLLQSRGSNTLSTEKMNTLNTLSHLCYKLARLKHAMSKLLSFDAPDTFISACAELKEIMKNDLKLNQMSNHSIYKETDILENYFYVTGLALISLGYLDSTQLFGREVRYSVPLPQLLQSDFSKLMTNAQLNTIIAELDAAINNKKDESLCRDKLTGIITTIGNTRDLLNSITEQMLGRYELAVTNFQKSTTHLGATLDKIRRLAFVLEAIPALNDWVSEWRFAGLKSEIKSCMSTCTANRTRLSMVARGLISDPWADAEKVISELNQLDDTVKLFITPYFQQTTSLLELQGQYQRLKENLITPDSANKKLSDARLAIKAYLEALDKTKMILQEHINVHKSDTLLAFTGRHWFSIFGGGFSGAGLATLTLLLSTNPAILAGVIVAGGVVGTASGATTGLALDIIKQKWNERPKEKAAVPYDPFWRSEYDSSVKRPEEMLAKANKP